MFVCVCYLVGCWILVMFRCSCLLVHVAHRFAFFLGCFTLWVSGWYLMVGLGLLFMVGYLVVLDLRLRLLIVLVCFLFCLFLYVFTFVVCLDEFVLLCDLVWLL